MSEELHPAAHWSNSCMTVIKGMSGVFLILSLIYLAIAGANFAVLGAIFVDAEWAGTARAAAFGGVGFVSVLALSLVGMWAASTRSELHVMVYAGIAAAVAVIMLVEVATSCFGAASAAFGVGYINGFSLFTGVLAAVCCGLAASSVILGRRLAASGAVASWPTADELVAAVEGGVPAAAQGLQAPSDEAGFAAESRGGASAEEAPAPAAEPDGLPLDAAPLWDGAAGAAEPDPLEGDADADEGASEDDVEDDDEPLVGNHLAPAQVRSGSAEPEAEREEPAGAVAPEALAADVDTEATGMLRIDPGLIDRARAGRAVAAADVAADPLQDLDEPEDEDEDGEDVPFMGRHFKSSR